MKNIAKFSILALAVATVACADLENPVGPEAPCGDNTLVFTANVPTKTVIADDDRTVSWAAGDEVKFVWADGETVTSASNAGSSTTFSITGVPAEVTEIYAVYPSSVCAGFADGEVTIEFGNALEGGEFSKADVCLAKAVKTDDVWNTTLNFKNAACLLKVGVSGEQTTRVQVMAVGEEAIAGNMPVSIDEDGNLVFGETTSGMTTVNMAIDQPGNYYIPVLPNVQLSDGFRVNCFEGETSLTPFYYNGAFTTQAGQIIKLSEIESRLGQYYVTPDGDGTMTGQSWTNAMNVDKFKAFVTNQDNHFLLKGATFHFSADEFSFGDNYLVLNYPDHSNVEFTFEGTVTPTDTTTFLGRTDTTGETAGILWPQNNTYLTVRNVKFTGTHGKSNYAAVRVNSGAKKLTFENCAFRDNIIGSGNGASIVLYNSCNLTIKDCSFSSNDGWGSALLIGQENAVVNISGTEFKSSKGNVIYGTKAKTVSLTDCIFRNNTSNEGDSGSAIYVESVGTYTISNTDFIGNQCNLGRNVQKGGVIMADSNDAVLRFDNCNFEGNDCYRTEQKNEPLGTIVSIYNKTPKFYFNKCKFAENTNGYVAGIGGQFGIMFAIRSSGGTIAMNNCAVYNNYSGRNTNSTEWFYVGTTTVDSDSSTDAKLLLANSTVIGCAQRKSGDSVTKNASWLFYLDAKSDLNFINSIICSTTTHSKYGYAAFNCWPVTVKSYFSKTSAGYGTDCTWSPDTGSGHNYGGTDAFFSGYDGTYIWNGTMLQGTNKDSLAPTSGVNEEINAADSDFYNWLNEIGALGKDINGNSRGATSWPGCYQAN